MNSKEKLKVLRRFNEEQLIDNVIVPLLENMGFKDITKMHGPGEQGIDLLFYKETEFGYNEYTGVQAKKEKIHGKAGKSGNATEILIQAQQAFSYTFIDVYDGKQKNIDKFFVITSDDIIPSAKKSIEIYALSLLQFQKGESLAGLIPSLLKDKDESFKLRIILLSSEDYQINKKIFKKKRDLSTN